MRMQTSGRKAAIAVLAIVLVLVLSAGGTLAYFTSNDHAQTTYRLTAIGMTFDETWNPSNGIGISPGDAMVKEPSFTNTDDTSYLLVTMNVTEGSNPSGGSGAAQVVTDSHRVALILNTLYYDPQGSIDVARSYTIDELAALPGVQRVFNATDFQDMTRAGDPAGTHIYGTRAALGNGQSVVLFSKVVIPSDYTQQDMQAMGNYTISLQGHAIQAAGFASRADAFAALLAQM